MPAPTFPPPAADDWSDLDDTSLVPTGKTAAQLDLTRDPKVLRPASGLSLGSCASTTKVINQVAQFKCDACNGSGRFVRNWRDYGPCNRCKGVGKLKTDPETRNKRKRAREDAKLKLRRAYIEQHKDQWAWVAINMARFDFARSMVEAVNKHGSWTDGQLAAILKCMARDVERTQEREAQVAAAPVIAGAGFDRMVRAFESARATGLKYPKLRVGDLLFTLAGAQSKYAGNSIFVKDDKPTYFGRIDLSTGKFLKTTVCSAAVYARIEEVCADPLAAAVMYGKQTGHCACCGLELENPESMRLGIGPICRKKWELG